MAEQIPRPHEAPNTGAEDIPPGATRRAFDRPENPDHGPPSSGAGPRHASGDPRGGAELNDSRQRHHEDLVPYGTRPEEDDRDDVPYAGPSGGAVGGTPAGGRSRGGQIHRGIDPGGGHRGDSTIGTDPSEE